MPRPRKEPKKGARANKRFLNDKRSSYSRQLIPVIANLVKQGETDFRIAEICGVSMSTLSNWKSKDPQLAKAMKRSEALIVKQTEATMWQRANGYSHDAEEIGYYRGKVIRTKTTKVYPPSEAAAKMMLGAAKPEKYRDRLEIGGDAARPVKFIIEGLEDLQEAKGAPASGQRDAEPAKRDSVGA